MTSEMPSHHGPADTSSKNYPNETMRLLIERSSCRSFKPDPINPETLQWVLEAGAHAATGGNLQPYSIIQIDDAAKRKKFAELCQQDFIAVAPTLFIFCVDFHRLERWAQIENAPFTRNTFPNFWIAFQDTIITAQNICTAADTLGLGTVYVGTVMDYFMEAHEMLALPKGVLPVVMVCIGYPKSQTPPRKKLPVEVVVHHEQYTELTDDELEEAFENKYPGQRVDISEERLETIAQVCRKVHSEEYAERCLETIKKYGYIRPVHRYFGLHYRADEMSAYNSQYVRALKELGFNIFEDFKKE